MTQRGDRLTGVYRQQLGRIRGGTVAAAQARWDTLPGFHDADAAVFAAAVAPVVTGGQVASVGLTAAYLRELALDEAGSALGDSIDPAVFAGVRGATPLLEVYQRPFVGLWLDLAARRDWLAAVAAARAELEREVSTDLQLATRDAAGAMVAADPRIAGWWRVTGARACAFCRLISTRLYYRDDLMPVHAHCGCTVRPAWRSETAASPVSHAIVSADYGPLIDERALRAQLDATGEAA